MASAASQNRYFLDNISQVLTFFMKSFYNRGMDRLNYYACSFSLATSVWLEYIVTVFTLVVEKKLFLRLT